VTRREVALDAARILQALAEFGVSYTVIGGLAVQAHGHTRTTQDVDLVPAPGRENLDRLARALDTLEAREAGQGPRLDHPALVARLSAAAVVSLDTDAGGVDVHRSPPGAAPYAQLASRALVIEVAGVSVPIAGRDDLIAMKRASGRPIDRGDVIALTTPERGTQPKP
jgi:hypothetical protein